MGAVVGSASIVAAYKLAVFVVEFSRFTDIDPQCKSSTAMQDVVPLTLLLSNDLSQGWATR